MSWDGFQREVLAELGLRAYALAGAEPRQALPSSAGQGAPSAPPGGLSPALLAALARAAGCAPDQVAGLAGIETAPDCVAARRALWPRLRRLRSPRR